jgi:hypothetical protein
MTSPSATQDRYPYQNEPIWSRSEKTVARAAFDAALKRELQEIIQEAKQMANQVNEPADLWDSEHYLTQRRKRSTASTTVGIRNLRTCSGDSCTNSDSVRKNCLGCGRTS